MTTEFGQVPPGPEEKYNTSQDLLEWMGSLFKRCGHIYCASIYGANAYVTDDPRYAQHVLVDNWQNYVKGQFIKRVAFLLGNGIMVSEGDLWKSQRRMIQPAFHRKAISGLNGLIARANFSLLQKWELAAQDRQPVNVTRDVSSMTLEVVLATIFGSDYSQIAPPFNILTEEPVRNMEFARAFRSLGKIILQVVDRRRKENTIAEDVLGMLLEARDQQTGQAMADGQLVNEILTLIVAGHETTASTLNWLWYLISQHPEVEKKLTDELGNSRFSYAHQIIDETLRLYPAGWLMTKRALKDDQLGPYFVRAGTEIYIPPYFIQRNPDLWEDPDSFKPDRFDPQQQQDRHRLAMLPFSAGPRNCVGEMLARTEMQIHVIMIARTLRLQYVQTKPLELEAGVNLRCKYDFIMTPEFKAGRVVSYATPDQLP